MSGILHLEAVRTPPSRDEVLKAQGIPADHDVPERVESLVSQAQALYESLVDPRGATAPISLQEFEAVYAGEGQNRNPTPLPEIVRNADHLALFAATLGAPLSQRINSLFRENDAALGYVLDSIASHRADEAADHLGRQFLDSLLEAGEVDDEARVLPYSPGYCGWHITGQRKLFAYLGPERIGITLTDSCLMVPMKSVSGVLVVAKGEAHDFDNDFDFCLDCTTWDCRDRIRSVS